MWHVAAEAISKFDLLSLVKEVYGLRVRVEPDETFVCDRSLDGSRFRGETGVRAPSWPEVMASSRATGRPRSTMSTGEPPLRPSIKALRLFLASVMLAFFIQLQ